MNLVHPVPCRHTNLRFSDSAFLKIADKAKGSPDCVTLRTMSTLEEIPLQHVGGKEVENRPHVTLTEPLKQEDTTDNTQETSSSGEGTAGLVVKSRWETVFTTAATLLATAFLNAGISMIAPFYPIVVSCIPVVMINKSAIEACM